MRLRPPYGVCALAAGLALLGHAAEPLIITVRVIDGRNGKPYARLLLPIHFDRVKKISFDSVADARANVVASERKRTDAKGEVRIPVPLPLPEVIGVDLTTLACGPDTFDTRQVIERGVVGENHCNGKAGRMNIKFQAKPGEVIVFAAPMSFWETIFH